MNRGLSWTVTIALAIFLPMAVPPVTAIVSALLTFIDQFLRVAGVRAYGAAMLITFLVWLMMVRLLISVVLGRFISR